MADEEKKKKPKIDLKARLGKTMAASGGGGAAAVPLPTPGTGSTPPPSGADGVPAPPAAVSGKSKGIAPPPGLSPGIPIPPFAQPKKKPAAEPKPSAQAQTIKVEVGEEVVEERRKAGRKTAIVAAIAALVGIGLGFVAGGAKERGDRAEIAIRGAGELSEEVKTATDTMQEMSVALDDAIQAIQNKKYPDEFADKLSSINVPFDPSKLQNRNVGALPGKLPNQLFQFTIAVEELNEQKDKLRTMLGYAKKPVETAWAEEEEPVFKLSVIFNGGSDKMYAELVPVKDPFKVKEDKWPEEFTVVKREYVGGEQKDVEKKAERWKKGDLTGETPKAIPINPDTVAAFTVEQAINELKINMRDLKEMLEGNDHPTDPKVGLMNLGAQLSEDLYNASLAM